MTLADLTAALDVRAVALPGNIRRQRLSGFVVSETLRLADDQDLPGPAGMAIDHDGGVDVVMADMEGVLAWQRLLESVEIADLTYGGDIAVTGMRDGWPWLVRTASR